MNRMRQRSMDISESYYLLLELCCCEPIIQQAFSIIENVCLAHGVTVSHCKPNFQRFIDTHYVPFLRNAVRAMHMYGFVPWRVMRLPSGDKVPEVLPAGTFRWTVETPKDSDSMLCYKVKLNSGAKAEENIFISQWAPPNFLVSEQSVMYATVSSPMSYVIESYKNMQAALKRQAHADAWNCTARIIVSHEPKEFSHDQHRKELFGTLSYNVDEYGQFQQHKPAQQADKIDETFETRSMNHTPAVYNLPAHHHIDQSPQLAPCTDIAFLQGKYKSDVCSLLGIPPELLITAQRSVEGNEGKERSAATNRIFQAKMQNVCSFLGMLASEVYAKIYKGSEATFDLVPMPRLEISKIDDLKTLHEIGVLQPDHCVELASILLGTKRKAKSNDQPQKKNAPSET